MTFQPTGQQAPTEGEMVRIDVGGAAVAVACVGGRLFGFQDECTHQQCSLSDGDLEGETVVCPCHLGQFDLRTGAVVAGPPPTPVQTWQVQVVDGSLEVAP